MNQPDADGLARFQSALRSGHAAEVLSAIEGLSPELRQQFEIRAREADLLGRLGRHEDEIALLEQLIASQPENPSLQLSLANALKTLGRSKDAVHAAREGLRIRPGYGKAWWVLADLKTFQFTDEDVGAMKTALADSPALPDRLHLHFALGRALEKRDPAAAFSNYAEGNRLRLQGFPSDSLNVTHRTDSIIATFTPDFFAARPNFGHESDAPIFIVGLQRSGSTLIEQILASHSKVEATGELTILGQLFRSVTNDHALSGTPLERLAAIDAARARDLAAEYLARAGDYRTTGKPRFIDKMPSNWLHIGFIKMILPNAVIIDARRHPMAAGFSNFRQNYEGGGAWPFSLEGIGTYYANYLRLMRHFDRVLPGKILHVVNERLIEDFEPQVRRLLDHVGVPFEPACLEFYKSGLPVRSASAEQVRRPVNSEGIDQWRAFEPWLQPLKDALGPALEDWQA